MSHATMANLRAYVQEMTTVGGSELTDFVSAYFENADPDELQARGSDHLLAIAKAHLRLLDQSANSQGARIRVFNPSLAEDGFVSEHSVIQIVHDDMPFLVDSVTMAVNRSGRIAHWIVHPLLVLKQDAQGRLIQTQLASANGQHLDPVKSFIFVECDRMAHETDRQAMARELARVLGDVHAAVTDWG